MSGGSALKALSDIVMKEESVTDFGLLIAYLLPGGIGLFGVGQLSPEIQTWLGTAALTSVTIGGFLTVTLVAVGVGLLASTIRWLVIDSFHHRTGIKPPRWEFARLAEQVEAYEFLVEVHYRYYQFYANSLVAMSFAYFAWRSRTGYGLTLRLSDGALLAVIILFVAASRDTLRKYYERAGSLLHG